MTHLKTTSYFREQVLQKRPYLSIELCASIIANPLKREEQPDGRIRFWGLDPEREGKYIRVVTLEDGETIHNALRDRNFTITDVS